ncbi:general stress protein [Paenibacillus psychroresistens]|uniref:General stress protein n=1 Tax=Paenibacillus psychroresistens TaxID=1778678 RepID=A0A6B8RHM8_9BACL|nr:general stress protein [Paenibacillus psychroresistens]QGQ94876.1 general stress protein [Paenibacillus psychroresistens]
MSTYTQVFTVDNILDARYKIQTLENEGIAKENIFVLTHNEKRTEYISKHTDGNQISVAEEGIFTAIANFFRSEGDGLRAKLRAMGVSPEHAEILESDMDLGKIVVLAWSGKTYDDHNYDQEVAYYPPENYKSMV